MGDKFKKKVKAIKNPNTKTHATNTKYEWLICYKSDGTLKQYCPND